MNIRFGRVGGIAALAAVATLTSGPIWAGKQVDVVETNAETSLLGVRLLSSTFKDVLHKYGQPSEIQAGGPYSPTPPPGAAPASGGGAMMGGPPGMGGGKMGRSMGGPGSGGPGMPGGAGMGGGGGGGKKQTSKNGFPGSSGGGGGAMGGPGSGGMMGGPNSGGMMGPGSGGPGLPGFGPGSPGSGGMGSGMGDEGGSESPGTGTSGETSAAVKETTWWYHDHMNGLHMAFVFNRVGQVIQIGEYGPKKMTKMNGVPVPSSGATRRGIVLGNSLGSVVKGYGWSLDGEHDAENIILRFGRKDKIAFQMVNNAILGITIGVTH